MIRTVASLTLSLMCGAFAANALAQPAFYTLGHGDIRAYYEDDELQLRYQLDGGAVVDGQPVDPDNYDPVSFSLGDLIVSIADVPLQSPDSRFDFTGASVGEDLWLIPEGGSEAQALSVPWLGFSTEELAFDDSWSGNQLQVNLISATGPGHVSMFFSPEDEFAAPQIHYATFDGIDASDVYRESGSADRGLSAGTHSHVNWAFTQPGFYDLTLKFSGEHATGGYKEAVGTVRFAMAVPEPSCLGLLAVAVVSAGLRRRHTPPA